MSRSVFKLFFLFLFFGIFFFYQKNVFAADYFFDDFNDTSIDSTKWDINNLVGGKRWCADELNNQYASGVWFDVATGSCHGTLDSLPLGNVNVANGEVAFSAPTSRSFPYMSSGPPNNFIFPPTGDFAFEIRLKFNSVTLHGTGAVALYWGDTTTLGNNPPKGPDEGLFGIWNDGYTQVRAVLLGQNVFLGRNFDYHKYRLEYRGGKYSVFFDDRLVVGPSSSSVRPTAILIGNPAFAFWNPWDWSDFSIDYVKVEKLDLAPEPFLDLPWEYEEKGLSFNEAALNINSFFDHEYPLLSTSLEEPLEASSSVIIYKGGGRDFDSDYSSHDGYDYGKRAEAEYGDDVLAAASGIASYINSCGPCGNAIHIDHGNGYQTRYYHLQSDGLITNTPGQSVQVNAGEQIGRVGATGNVRPPGEAGAHIHFMVVQDKNDDGNFDDNIPDGLVDPFGWQSEKPDPWENYEFFYNGENRIGNKSYYLWNNQIDNLNANLTANGGVFNSGRNSVTFPAGATNQNLLLEILSSPMQKLSDLISSIGSSVQIIAKDSSGNPVTNFNQPFTVEISFADFDLSRFLTDTLSIYSSSDGINWIKEDTNVDLQSQNATTEVDHLTYFALMAERADTQAATTTATLAGEEGEQGWFRSDVSVSLEAVDNEGGLGVDYVLYKKDDGDWQEYIAPIQFSDEGEHNIEFYSVDNDENIEESKAVTFNIDKTSPEAEIKYNPDNLDLEIIGIDSSGSAVVNLSDLPKNKKSIKITDQAGNLLEIIGKDKEKGRSVNVTIESLQYNQEPLINVDSTKLLVSYSLDSKTSDLKQLEQKYEVKNELKIKLTYSSKTGRTTVITKVKDQEKVKEELPGIRILKLRSERGTLKYSY